MILWEQDQINDRWKGYFDNLLHLENLGAPGISSEEVELALRIMKTRKAMAGKGRNSCTAW